MSLQVENLEKNMAKLTIEVSAEEFEKAIEKAYQKGKKNINVQGFRKGKAPRAMIEKMYGAGMFYEEAANIIIPEAYEKAAEESDLDIVSQPEIDVTQIEKGKSFIFTAEIAVKPEVTLGEYKGIEIEKKNAEVSPDEITAELDKIREQNSRTITVEDRAVQMGDTLMVDYEGFVDGTAFDGGKGEDQPLVIGSHSFIDTFEDQLIGKNIGEDVEVNVTFPEPYQAAELAGKPALFKVKIKEIKAKELPELDDDFAQDVSDFETMDEYKADVEKKLFETKEKQIKNQKEETIIEKIVENASMDIPEPMIDSQVRQMADDFAQRVKSQGLSMEQYLQFTGMDTNKLLDQMRPQAQKRIATRLTLEAVVKAEAIAASEEEIQKEIENMAAMYQMEVEKLTDLVGDSEREQIALDVAVQKAVDLVIGACIEK